MNVWTFLIAAVVALPKQLVNVYLGSTGYSNAPINEDGSRYLRPLLVMSRAEIGSFHHLRQDALDGNENPEDRYHHLHDYRDYGRDALRERTDR